MSVGRLYRLTDKGHAIISRPMPPSIKLMNRRIRVVLDAISISGHKKLTIIGIQRKIFGAKFTEVRDVISSALDKELVY